MHQDIPAIQARWVSTVLQVTPAHQEHPATTATQGHRGSQGSLDTRDTTASAVRQVHLASRIPGSLDQLVRRALQARQARRVPPQEGRVGRHTRVGVGGAGAASGRQTLGSSAGGARTIAAGPPSSSCRPTCSNRSSTT